MCAHSLPSLSLTLRTRFHHVQNHLIHRFYKTVMTLLKLLPEMRTPSEESIFDKIYIIQLLQQSLNASEQYRLRSAGCERAYEELKTLAKGGGTKNKSVKEISETSKVLKEYMDQELREIIRGWHIRAEFYLQSTALRKVWKRMFPDEYRVGLDMFVQGFNYLNGDQFLTKERVENMKGLFSMNRDDSEDKNSYTLHLEHIVNITDFIPFSTLLRLFEPDQFDLAVDKLRSESSLSTAYLQDEILGRLQESIKAKYLSRDLDKMRERTVFVRTGSDLKRGDVGLVLVWVYGANRVWLEYRERLLQEIMEEELALEQKQILQENIPNPQDPILEQLPSVSFPLDSLLALNLSAFANK